MSLIIFYLVSLPGAWKQTDRDQESKKERKNYIMYRCTWFTFYGATAKRLIRTN